MKSFEESITRFAICFIMGATLLAMLSVAALSQDGHSCQNNPAGPAMPSPTERSSTRPRTACYMGGTK